MRNKNHASLTTMLPSTIYNVIKITHTISTFSNDLEIIIPLFIDV